MADPWAEYRIPSAPSSQPRSSADEFYDELAEQVRQRETTQRQRRAIVDSTGNPDQAARARALSQQLNTPRPVVEADLAGHEQLDRLNRTAEAAKDPALGGWLGDNSDIASDDIPNLLLLRDGVGRVTDGLQGSMLLRGVKPPRRVKPISDEAWQEREATLETQRRMGRGVVGQVAGSLRAGVAGASAGIYGSAAAAAGIVGADSVERALLNVARVSTDYAQEQRGRSTNFIVDSMYSGVESLPVSIAAALTGGLGTASALFLATTGGQEYAEARDQGLSVGKSALYGGSQGGIEVLTGRLPVGELIKLAGGKTGVGRAIKRFLIGEALGEQVATVLQDFNEWATLNPEKPFASYVAERPEAAARTFIASSTASGPQVGAAYALNRILAREAAREVDKASLEAIDGVMESAAESKVRGRDTSAFRALIEQLGGDGQSIYVPAEAIAAYNQDYRDDEFWRDYADDVDEALATGGDVAVPLSDAMARLPGTPAWDAIRADVRASPNGHSLNEIEQANAEIEGIELEAAEEADQAERSARREAAPGERLRQSIRDRLMNTGMTPDQAAANAEVTAALFETEAANLGREITGREFEAVQVQRVLPELLQSEAPETLDLVINAMRQGKDAVSGVGPSLLQFIRQRGGINDPGGDLKSMGLSPRLIREFNADQGTLGGISGAGDYGVDTTLRAAIEAGFFPELVNVENESGPSQLNTQVLLDAIGQEIAGNKVYAETREDQMRAAGAELRAIIESAGLDPETASPADIRAAIERDGRTLEQPQELPATIEIDGTQSPTRNSEGMQIAPTEEGVRAFWAWFGDSKVVDADGRPLVVYHGTGQEFDAFNTDGGTGKSYGTGAFFSASPAVASTYATGSAASVAPVYLRMTAPVEIDAQGRNWNSLARTAKVNAPAAVVSDASEDALFAELTGGEPNPNATKKLKAKKTTLRKVFAGEMEYDDDTASTDDVVRWARDQGYEAAIVQNVRDHGPSGANSTDAARQPTTIFVAFDPSAVKSINNRGTFDPSDPRILYQQDGGNPSANISFTDIGAIIRLFETANASSFQHELGHFWLERFKGNALAATDTDGNEAARRTFADWETLKAWFRENGHEVEGDVIPEGAHELFARGWERYLMEGKAPSVGLQGAFRKFAAWMKSIYRAVKNLNAPISPEVREVMDRMLATQDQIDEAQREAEVRLMFDMAVKKPPVKKGFVRLYHGGTKGGAGEWVSSSKSYAQGYADRSVEPTMFFIDISRDDPRLESAAINEFKGTANITLTDKEIARLKPLSTNPLTDVGMTDAEARRYARLGEDARSEAEEELLGKVMRSIRARETKAWQEQEATVRERVKAEVERQPVFRALGLLREKGGVRLNKQWLVDNYGEDSLGLLPAGMPVYSATGQNADALAEQAGFSSGDEMVRALMAMEATRREMKAGGDKRSVKAMTIDFAVSQEMHERFGDPLNDGTIEREAMSAVRNERNGERLAMELKALGRQVGRKATTYQMARRWAKDRIASGIVSDAISGASQLRYNRTATKAAKEATEAFLKGDSETAFRHKQTEMLNNALAREAARAAERVDAAVKRMGDLAGKRTVRSMDQDYLEQIHALLEAVDFKTRSQASINRKQSFEEWVASRPEGEEVYVPAKYAWAGTNWTRLTVNELLDLNETVRSIEHLGRLKQTLIDNKERRDFEAFKVEALGTLEETPGRKLTNELGDPSRPVAGVFANLMKMEVFAAEMDNDRPGGAWQRLLVQRPTEAANDRDAQRDVALNPIADAYNKLDRKTRNRLSEKITIPEMLHRSADINDPRNGTPLQMTRWDVVGMALNLGTESNLDKLSRGYGISPEVAETIVNRTLTEGDWQFVQTVWDSLDSLRPYIAATEKEMSGVAPEWQAGRVVKTPFGDLKGGYYPIVYDPSQSQRAEDNALNATNDLFGNRSGVATSRGHTITRTDYAAPLELSPERVIFQHIEKVITRNAYAPWVRDVLKVVKDPAVRASIDRKFGTEFRQQIEPWLRQQVREGMVNENGTRWAEHFLRSARVNLTVVSMGFRWSTGIAQVLGLGNSIARVGASGMRRGMQRMLSNPAAAAEFVFARSPEMKRRNEAMNRDVAEAFQQMRQTRTGRNAILRKAGAWQSKAQVMAFWHIGMIDRYVVAMPTWLGAYDKAIRAGMDDVAASAEGDKAVRLSQGSGRAKDLAAWQSNQVSEGLRFFTMFYTPFNVLLNAQWETGRAVRRGDWRKATSLALWFMIATPLMEAVLAGDWPEDDDEEGWASWLARNVGFYAMAGIPVVRDAANYAERKMIGEFATFSPGPIGRIFEASERAATTAWDATLGDDEVSDRWVRTAIETPGYFMGMPTGQVSATAQFIYDVNTGEADPRGFWEWYEGLTKGRVKED